MKRIIDLTLHMEAGMPVPAALPPVEMQPLQRHADFPPGAPRSVELYRLGFPEHVGTHLDAPFHFSADGMTVDEMPLDKLLFGSGRLLDFQGLSDREPITAAMVLRAEAEVGKLQPDEAVFIHTGYWRNWGKANYFAAPFLTAEAGDLLLQRNISLLAIDTSTPDDTRGEERVIHDQFLKKHGIPILEGAANLDRIPVNPFSFVALPLKIRGGSGSPVRLVAVVEHWHE